MKAGNQLIELSFCIVCALAPSALWTLNAVPAANPPIESGLVSDRESVHGNIRAKTEAGLTVEGKVINTTAATFLMNNGKPIALADVKVGDRVKVAATKGANGSLKAVSIELK